MEIIRAGNFVLGCSKETKDEIEDAVIRELASSLVLEETKNKELKGIREKIEEIPSNKMYYYITHEQLDKLFEGNDN